MTILAEFTNRVRNKLYAGVGANTDPVMIQARNVVDDAIMEIAKEITDNSNLGGDGATIFTSSAFSTAGGTKYTVAHGLGSKPDILKLYLRQSIGIFGYAVGDIIEIPINSSANPSAVWADATNIYMVAPNTGSYQFCDGVTGARKNVANTAVTIIVEGIIL